MIYSTLDLLRLHSCTSQAMPYSFLFVRLQSELGAVGGKAVACMDGLLNNDTVWDNVMIQRGSEPQLRK